MKPQEIKRIADNMIKNGLAAQEAEKIGVFSALFKPFYEIDDPNGWYDPENGSYEERYSTIYGGWRWYFETAEQLKDFCEAVEQA